MRRRKGLGGGVSGGGVGSETKERYFNKMTAVDKNQARTLAYAKKKQEDWTGFWESNRTMRDREG